jgi:hypothetical protein
LIGRKAFVEPRSGILWAILPDGTMEQVTADEGIAPAYRNLINASLLLYNTNVVVANGLSAIAEWAEATGNDRIVHAVTTFEANLNLARVCALEGLEKVAARQK